MPHNDLQYFTRNRCISNHQIGHHYTNARISTCHTHTGVQYAIIKYYYRKDLTSWANMDCLVLDAVLCNVKVANQLILSVCGSGRLLTSIILWGNHQPLFIWQMIKCSWCGDCIILYWISLIPIAEVSRCMKCLDQQTQREHRYQHDQYWKHLYKQAPREHRHQYWKWLYQQTPILEHL